MNMMDSLSSPLAESYQIPAFPSSPPSPTGTDTDFPIEVDRSFNSSMTISDEGMSVHSPTPSSQLPRFAEKFSPVRSNVSMSTNGFLSPVPAPPIFKGRPVRPALSPIQQTRGGQHTAPAFPTVKRAFGSEWSSNAPRAPLMAVSKSKGMMAPPAVPEGRALKARPALPADWAVNGEKENKPRMMAPTLSRRETAPVLSPQARVAASDAMDVDSPSFGSRAMIIPQSPSTSLAGSIDGSPGLGAFFEDSPAPAPALPPSKRRSMVDDSPSSSAGSPTAKRSSLGRPSDKVASTSALLFPRPTTLGTRRPQPYNRRPLLTACQPGPPVRSDTVASAFPILQRPATGLGTFPRGAPAPMRRAQSVCDQPPKMDMSMSEEESEFEASPSVEYARRTGSRVVPRVDGSPGFKPMRSSLAIPMEACASPSGKGKKASAYGSGGLPNFGDNEMDGKILPCHKVKEDGLVRVAPSTVCDLLAGKYNDKIKRYHIIDCRFEYEYEGGHIENAIHVKEMGTLDELLLSESSGVHAGGVPLPQPSRSGELGDGEQVVLIFHCEFSAKRAPTFAKHLRSRDRTMNSASYPRIFYPEVYILEGGYCGFYKDQPSRCNPCGYTPMDDPKHFARRDTELHTFRNFGRTKSFTYGETSGGGPACPPLAFAAASAAIGRRTNQSAVAITITEEEHDDQDHSSSPHAGDSSVEIDASPSLRVASMPQPPIFGSARPRTLGRMGFQRNASYAGFGAGPVR